MNMQQQKWKQKNNQKYKEHFKSKYFYCRSKAEKQMFCIVFEMELLF